MNMHTRMIVTAATLLLLASGLWAQSKTITRSTKVITGTVEAVNSSTRVVTIKDKKGEYEQVHMPGDKGKRITKIKIGDKITVRYYDNLIVSSSRDSASTRWTRWSWW